MTNPVYEVNFDSIVGPTHNYSGLSYGNIASKTNRLKYSNPKEAALQGLKKIKFLADRGIKQAVFPPHERPNLSVLQQLGFIGAYDKIIKSCYQVAPEILFACSSASPMWSANTATVCPSSDSLDQRVHITPANLANKFHRSFEYLTAQRIIKKIFNNSEYFVHHSALPPSALFSDEGAANHNRFAKTHGHLGIHLFVYGRIGMDILALSAKHFPARQTYEASRAIARLHKIDPNCVIFAQQHPDAIDQGVFHNDVISVANENVFFFHQKAFLNQHSVIDQIRSKMFRCSNTEMFFLEVTEKDVTLKEAVDTYLFNSQIITTSQGKMTIIAPIECQQNERVRSYLENLISNCDTPINEIHFFNLKESMQNGGGPACLRLRVVLNQNEIQSVHSPIFLTTELYDKLVMWINHHYRDRLHPDDFKDPKIVLEGQNALDDLTAILQLGPIYDFQIS